MRRRLSIFGTILILNIFFQISCVSVPHMILPQKDIQPGELNEPGLDKKILVASRYSDFKQTIVEKIKTAFQDESVYIKFIGLGQIEEENADQYNAVVMINTCMSWDMDRNVHGFLKRYKDHSNMIILTTSGDGNWLPKMKGRNFDAISSASKKANADEVANEIITKINSRLE